MQSLQVSAQEIATLLGGQLDGDGQVSVRGLAKIEEAGPGDLSFIANPRYERYLYKTAASVVLVSQGLALPSGPPAATLIRVADPYSAFTLLLAEAGRRSRPVLEGIEQPSYIARDAQLGQGVYVGAFAYVGAGATLEAGVQVYPHAYVGPGCHVGEGTILYPGAVLYHQTRVGRRCVVHSGAVIGADGFGHAPQPDGSYVKIPQLGIVEIEDDVEVGASTIIDRATLGATRIGQGTKLDNLIQIAHNVEVGRHVVMAAQAGVSGSSKIGDGAQIGGQVGVAGHLHVYEGTKIAAQSGIMSDTPAQAGTVLMGSPAIEYRQFFRMYALMRRLPELERRVRELERAVADPPQTSVSSSHSSKENGSHTS